MNLESKKPNSILKTSAIIIGIIVMIFIVLEILARKKFDSFSYGSCPHEKLPGKLFFYIPLKNCKISIKHWESSKEIVYETDENANRISSIPANFNSSMTAIAFFGDSFTWGAMNNVDENYTHYTVATLKTMKDIDAGYNNFGVAGYNLLQVLERMRRNDLKGYNYIVYGLTPNDLFSPQTATLNEQQKQESTNIKKDSLIEIFKKKIYRHKLQSIKVASKFLFDSFPKIYIYLYTLRDSNLAGYLSSSSSPYWNNRYSELLGQLKNLNSDIKSRLIIQVIPQRVQVLLYAEGDLSNATAFEDRIEQICNELDIKYNDSQLPRLAGLENSHFTIDGHFTASANVIIGRRLAEFISGL
jgi:hypothetical protein|tara:strand:- start:1086 stop:2156 length:1071 start_codon:yes stop_codon:yes gene_type:complete